MSGHNDGMCDERTLSIAERVAVDGYAVVEGVLGAGEVAGLIGALSGVDDPTAVRRRNDAVYAVRNLLDIPAVAGLAASPAVRALVEPILGPGAFPVRGILFDKTAAANWNVFWHQDLAIAVDERRDVPGFGPWTVKAGIPHVQPPASVLERMITVRAHLDDCGPGNGPLQVLPGSHAHGRLDGAAAAQWRETVPPALCVCRAGGVVLMRPLLLHASSSATQPGHRRVVHVEYAACDLPGGLRWHARLQGGPDS